MTRGVNKVIIVGTVGQDPEAKTFPDGGMVAVVSLATNEQWKDKQTGQEQQSTEWHRVVLRDRGNYKMGSIASQYVRKGGQLYIEGKLRTRSYDKNGQKFFITEIIATEMQMLGGNPQNNSQAPQQPQQQYKQQTRQPLQQQAQQPSQQAQNGFADAGFIDDDIPF